MNSIGPCSGIKKLLPKLHTQVGVISPFDPGGSGELHRRFELIQIIFGPEGRVNHGGDKNRRKEIRSALHRPHIDNKFFPKRFQPGPRHLYGDDPFSSHIQIDPRFVDPSAGGPSLFHPAHIFHLPHLKIKRHRRIRNRGAGTIIQPRAEERIPHLKPLRNGRQG